MPRTKRVAAKKASNKKSPVSYEDSDTISIDKVKVILASMDKEAKEIIDARVAQSKHFMEKVNFLITAEMSLYDPAILAKTIGELNNQDSTTLSSTVSSYSLSVKSYLQNSTFSMKKKKKQADDEAADNTRSISGERIPRATRQRSISEKTGSKRKSRSLSKSKLPKNVTILMPSEKKFVTPCEKRMLPPNSFPFVTPKCKPNTPMAVLRRPRQGEMAISMQGSPLFVGSGAGGGDDCANVNIPLRDGRVLSLQPRNIRKSEIPTIDPETQKQLETLRENLDKVCRLAADA